MLGDLGQIEYTLSFTPLQLVWKILRERFEVLKLIPCTPEDPVPGILGSESPGFADFAHNPFMGFVLYRDTQLLQDLLAWMINPQVCTEWMMNHNRQNLPFDMYDSNKGFFQFYARHTEPLSR